MRRLARIGWRVPPSILASVIDRIREARAIRPCADLAIDRNGPRDIADPSVAEPDNGPAAAVRTLPLDDPTHRVHGTEEQDNSIPSIEFKHGDSWKTKIFDHIVAYFSGTTKEVNMDSVGSPISSSHTSWKLPHETGFYLQVGCNSRKDMFGGCGERDPGDVRTGKSPVSVSSAGRTTRKHNHKLMMQRAAGQ